MGGDGWGVASVSHVSSWAAGFFVERFLACARARAGDIVYGINGECHGVDIIQASLGQVNGVDGPGVATDRGVDLHTWFLQRARRVTEAAQGRLYLARITADVAVSRVGSVARSAPSAVTVESLHEARQTCIGCKCKLFRSVVALAEAASEPSERWYDSESCWESSADYWLGMRYATAQAHEQDDVMDAYSTLR